MRWTIGLAVGGLLLATFPFGLDRRQPGAAAAPDATRLFADDFSDPTSGWPIQDSATSRLDYVEGEYLIEVKQVELASWANNGPQLGDFDAEVEARAGTTAGSLAYALLFGVQAGGRPFYAFQVDPSDSSYVLLRLDGNAWSTVVAPERSHAILAHDAVNRLGVERRGNRIRLRVNDVVLAEVVDGTLGAGRLGLLAANFDIAGPAPVFFDNLTVYEPGLRPRQMAAYLPRVVKEVDGRPDPEPTPTPAPGIFGRVTLEGLPAADVALTLRQQVGTTPPTEVGSVRTAWNGEYHFHGVNPLPAGSRYHVAFGPQNQDPGRVAAWFGPDIFPFTAGQRAAGGNFDIGDIVLLEPEPEAAVASPVAFRWQPRPVPDTYRLFLADPETSTVWSTQDLGHRGRVSVNKPTDAVAGKTYRWYVQANMGDDNSGVSYYYRNFQFVDASPVAARAAGTMGRLGADGLGLDRLRLGTDRLIGPDAGPITPRRLSPGEAAAWWARLER